jgi:cephalosporin hydroxylase
MSCVATLDEAIDFAYSWKSWGIAICPFQDKREIATLFKDVEQIKPRTVIEIGTGWGGTLFLFATVASSDATLISIDLPSSLFGRGYPKWKNSLYKSFARNRQEIELVRGNSHQASSVEAVKRCLGSRQVDVLFIDGDHTYEGVKKDFELYSPMVRKGGLIAFHDITPNLKNSEIEVPQFWNELRDVYENSEIKLQQEEAGIGILRV